MTLIRRCCFKWCRRCFSCSLDAGWYTSGGVGFGSVGVGVWVCGGCRVLGSRGVVVFLAPLLPYPLYGGTAYSPTPQLPNVLLGNKFCANLLFIVAGDDDRLVLQFADAASACKLNDGIDLLIDYITSSDELLGSHFPD